MAYDAREIYVTNDEPEAYNLAGELVQASIPCSVNHDTTNAGHPFYIVKLRNAAQQDAARAIRVRVIGS